MWIIDTDDLADIPEVSIDRAVLAEMAARRAVAEAGGDVIARLSRLETEVTRLRGEVAELARRRGRHPSAHGQVAKTEIGPGSAHRA